MINIQQIITALTLLMAANMVYSGVCECEVPFASGQSCQLSVAECQSWCNDKFNTPRQHAPSIRFETGGCAAHCGKVDIKPHSQFPVGKQWEVCTGYRLVFQHDGNLVVFNPLGAPVWAANTHGKNAKTIIMQTDGNLVIYNAGNQPLWASRTDGNPGSVLTLQDDGNVVLFNAFGKPIWDTGTNGR